ASPGSASPGSASPGSASPGSASPGSASPGSASPDCGALCVTAPGRPDLQVPVPGPDAPQLKVSVWSSVLVAAAAGPTADAWFSAYLGRPVNLVYLDDPATRRPVSAEFGQDGDTVSFADGYPLLLTTTGSLDDLGRWLAADGDQPVPMTRFRPNVVVAGTRPWAEDRWLRVRIGEVPFRVVKPCGRCVVTTIDQQTGVRGRQPLKVLGRHRRFGKELVFGQNLIPDRTGVIRVGDPVEVLESTPG
ncbi:MAG: MOSC domain-containing protein, partial [Streptosporangiaceae bacterium]